MTRSKKRAAALAASGVFIGTSSWKYEGWRGMLYDESRYVKKRKGFSPENIARLEQEMAVLERDFKAVEAGYGQNVLHLTLASAYIRKLLENVRVSRMLQAGHADLYAGLKKIAAIEAL